jgi:hypothetical protein
MCLAGFSPRSTAFALYVLSGAKGEEKLLSRLGKFKQGKGCLYLKRLADVDQKVLEELVRESSTHTRKVQQCEICVESRTTKKKTAKKRSA